MNIVKTLKCVILAGALFGTVSFAQTTPAEVYQHVSRLTAEVDLIRLEMGISITNKPKFAISGAQPREVYFQALTLFKKANRLLFEQIREREDLPAGDTSDITPEDVIVLVDAASQLILRVKIALNITETIDPPLLDTTKTPTDVYQQIVQLNRTLNSLLHERFAPADVYQQLTYGIGLASEILVTLVNSDRLGREPELVRRKTPHDVYLELIDVYATIHEIMRVSGLSSLTIEPQERERIEVSPSDVYDLASLLVAELSYLHQLTPGVGPPHDSYYPGEKLPSHVFQRAGRLRSQIGMLREYAVSNPDWLGLQ